jgi:hypothetical protein
LSAIAQRATASAEACKAKAEGGSNTHQLLFMASMGFAKRSTHPTHYVRSSAEVKNLVPSKNRFGRVNMEMNVAPFGACAT